MTWCEHLPTLKQVKPILTETQPAGSIRPPQVLCLQVLLLALSPS